MWKVLRMLSTMESTGDLFHAAQRAEAAPFINYPRGGWWHPPLYGLWWGAVLYTASWPGYASDTRRWTGLTVHLALGILLLVLMGIHVAQLVRRRGTYPSMRAAPKEIKATWLQFQVACLVVLAAFWGIWALAGRWWGIGAAAVLATAVVAWYEHAYGVAVQKVRDRLS